MTIQINGLWEINSLCKKTPILLGREEYKVKIINIITCLPSLVEQPTLRERKISNSLYFQELLQNIIEDLQENSHTSSQELPYFLLKYFLSLQILIYESQKSKVCRSISQLLNIYFKGFPNTQAQGL